MQQTLNSEIKGTRTTTKTTTVQEIVHIAAGKWGCGWWWSNDCHAAVGIAGRSDLVTGPRSMTGHICLPGNCTFKPPLPLGTIYGRVNVAHSGDELPGGVYSLRVYMDITWHGLTLCTCHRLHTAPCTGNVSRINYSNATPLNLNYCMYRRWRRRTRLRSLPWRSTRAVRFNIYTRAYGAIVLWPPEDWRR